MIWPPPDLPYFYTDRKLENSWGLWTESGGECINVVFAFDRKTRIVETYNETD